MYTIVLVYRILVYLHFVKVLHVTEFRSGYADRTTDLFEQAD